MGLIPPRPHLLERPGRDGRRWGCRRINPGCEYLEQFFRISLKEFVHFEVCNIVCEDKYNIFYSLLNRLLKSQLILLRISE